MKKFKFYQLVVLLLIIFFAICGIYGVVGNFAFYSFSVTSIVNAVLTLVVCGIFCMIFSFILKASFNQDKKTKKSVSKNNPVYYEKLKNYAKFYEEKYSDQEIKEYEKEYKKSSIKNKLKFKIDAEKLKRICGALALFIACGIGYIPLFLLGANSSSKIKSSSNIPVEATVKFVQTDINEGVPRYVYEVDGEYYISQSGASYGAIQFKDGSKTTIYVNRSNPEIIYCPSDCVMTYFGATLFLVFGIFIALACLGVVDKVSSIAAMFMGFLFMLFGVSFITASALASGLPFYILACSGTSVAACLCFAAVGLLLFGFGIKELFVNISAAIHVRKDYKNTYKEVFGRKSIDNQNSNNKVKNIEVSQNDTLVDGKPTEKKTKKKEKCKKRISFSKESLGMLFAGLLFAGVGIVVLITTSIIPLAKTRNMQEVTATVTRVETYYNKKGNLLAVYDYTYEYNGETYEKHISYGQSPELAPNQGDTIKVYIDKTNPDIVFDDLRTPWILLPVSLIFAIVGIGLTGFGIHCSVFDVIEDKDKKENEKIAK